MPNPNPLIRTMEWERVLQRLPEEISRHIPRDNPHRNRKEIRKILSDMSTLGPRGDDAKRRYVNGEISLEEFESKIEQASKKLNAGAFVEFQQTIEKLERGLCGRNVRFLVPGISALRMGFDEMRVLADEISGIQLYGHGTTHSDNNQVKCKNVIKMG